MRRKTKQRTIETTRQRNNVTTGFDMWKAYVPNYILVHSKQSGKFVDARVSSVVSYPVGQHPKDCPIVDNAVAVEIRTALGSRWYGFDNAYIDGSLRMVVERLENRDKVLALWEPVVEHVLKHATGEDINGLCARCLEPACPDTFCARCEEYLSQDDPGALLLD